MKLRTKLLLGVGLLLFAMALIMYLLPTIFIRRDVYKAADEIHHLLIEEHHHLIQSQQLWLQEALIAAKANNSSLLLMLYQEPNFSDRLLFGSKNQASHVWGGLAQLIGFSPSIGFAQIHNPNTNQTALIKPNEANIYPIDLFRREGKYVLLSLLNSKGDFIGVPLPKELQKESGYTLYALIDPKTVTTEVAQVDEEIAKLTPEHVQQKLFEATLLTEGQGGKSHHIYEWAVKVEMIRSLTPLFVEGLALSEAKRLFPEGLARVDDTGNGYVMLTQEAFSTEPLFDDVSYYKLNQPMTASSPPLASGAYVVTNKERNTAYVANTLLLDNNYISTGFSLAFLARQLALSSSRIIFLKVKNDFWMGFDTNGNHLPQNVIKQFVGNILPDQDNGTVNVDKSTYFFSKVISLVNDSLLFYDFRLFGGEQSIVSTLFSLENRLTHRIAWQLSLIALGTMFLVLLFIGRIGLHIIYPVTKLARATQDVAAGKYAEVVLPEVGNRQDEVAILTRSFDEMVKGLQDREKIRGVLDKVVSKDVADEILKTHIHLGGEDRIVTMLFSDIRGFTSLTRELSPQTTIHILNACMTKVSRVIEGEGGVIDKYVGDEVMGIFGAPTSHPDHALRAVSSGMLIIETLKKWNQGRAAAGEVIIEMGIGIHTGLVVAGNMGAEDRLNYTVLGTNVNIAARLCELTKPNQLIISADTLNQPNIKESFYTNPLPSLTLKGFTEPIEIYEVTGFKWEE